MKKPALEHLVFTGFALATVILVVIGVASYQSTARFLEATRLARHSADVLAPVHDIFATTYRIESAQRAYLVSGDAAYLEERRAAQAQVDLDLKDLRKLAGDSDPALSAHIDQLERLVAGRLAVLERVLDLRNRAGLEAAAEALGTDSGRAEMAALEQEVHALVRERRALLWEQSSAAQSEGDILMRNFFLALGFVAITLSVLMVLVRREMTSRQRALAALANSEARLNAVVDTAVDAIIVIDERAHIERFNRAAERMFGYTAQEVIGRNVSMLMPQPYRGEHDGYMERYLRTGEKRIIGIGREVSGQRKDGSVFPIDLAVAEFRVGGQRRFSGLIRDITARKRAEERQAELVRELEAANEELRSFAYIASHDLKAPLRAIASLADWISADYADKFDDDGREQMRLLIGRVRRMDQLIDGILQYSRVGRVKEERVTVDLNTLLAEVVDLLAPPPHIQVTVHSLPTLVTERTRIQQVFQNLISNAIRYMDKPEGRIEVGAEPSNGGWRFYVRDNGPGIEERHRERIFLLFQTLQPRDRTESTGIGLSLVKKIVEMYGGRVWLDSTPREGSTFYFTLPMSDRRSD